MEIHVEKRYDGFAKKLTEGTWHLCNTASGAKDRRRRAIDLHEEHNHVILQPLQKTTINKAFFGSGAKVQQITPITHEEVEDKSD